MPRKNINAEDFVKFYQAAATRKEVADKFGITEKAVALKAGNLRRNGVTNLKRFPAATRKGVKRIDYAALNAAAAAK